MRTYSRVLAFAALFGLLAGIAHAQTATPQNHFGFTASGFTPAQATAATYKLYEGATPLGTLANVTCITAGADADCTADIPPLVQGTHTVTITQNSQGAESPKSNAISFTYVIVVTPSNFRIKDLADAGPADADTDTSCTQEQ